MMQDPNGTEWCSSAAATEAEKEHVAQITYKPVPEWNANNGKVNMSQVVLLWYNQLLLFVLKQPVHELSAQTLLGKWVPPSQRPPSQEARTCTLIKHRASTSPISYHVSFEQLQHLTIINGFVVLRQ